ncbi:MAG: hypothetical protein IKV59_04900 [Lachnospiraceae bacterium]|nr:hypothetical protein [Lachnospiraceae bacterium]
MYAYGTSCQCNNCGKKWVITYKDTMKYNEALRIAKTNINIAIPILENYKNGDMLQYGFCPECRSPIVQSERFYYEADNQHNYIRGLTEAEYYTEINRINTYNQQLREKNKLDNYHFWTIVMLILCYPIGFILLWNDKKINERKRKLACKIFAWFIGIGMLISMVSFGIYSALNPTPVITYINPPYQSYEMSGDSYTKVINELENAGFTNIKTEKIEDLIIGWLTFDGEVEKVTINGSIEYTVESEFIPETEVIVYYHTFPEKTVSIEEPAEITDGISLDNLIEQNTEEKEANDNVETDTILEITATELLYLGENKNFEGLPINASTKEIYDTYNDKRVKVSGTIEDIQYYEGYLLYVERHFI